ncbi:hypothetical protein [Actomonas aquatica]|uniref:HIRAN domain-containing protein n=1 Tax=Actomonas aquatica TaxID=2866162 RepID=A0ABZ1C5H5_9BACT|nr:hypothetical protein [Opitutus sp. WL0086]WRQ86981.1 hypothetical protein K1X11_019375 [Opitutus sp. WL0086]
METLLPGAQPAEDRPPRQTHKVRKGAMRPAVAARNAAAKASYRIIPLKSPAPPENRAPVAKIPFPYINPHQPHPNLDSRGFPDSLVSRRQMARSEKYSFDKLVEIYIRYAALKGWSTRREVAEDKVDSWLTSSIGPVGIAISFHEEGVDHLSHMGIDAGARAKSDSIQHIMVTLAGTEYPNEDGSSRVAAALTCEPFEVLGFAHEPGNQYDPRAFRVFRRLTGKRLGYIPRRVVPSLLDYDRDGFVFTPMLAQIHEPDRIMYPPGSPDRLKFAQIEIVLFTFRLAAGTEVIDSYAGKWEEDYKAETPDWDWRHLRNQ